MGRWGRLAWIGVATTLMADVDTPAPDRFRADELIYTTPLDAGTAKELEPIHSMEGVVALFQRHHVPFQRRTVTLPTTAFPDAVWARIDTLPVGEPLVVPNGARGGAVLVILVRHVADDA